MKFVLNLEAGNTAFKMFGKTQLLLETVPLGTKVVTLTVQKAFLTALVIHTVIRVK